MFGLTRFVPQPTPGTTAQRPGTVTALRGVVFQSDAGSFIGAWIIRPFEAIDRRIAGLQRSGEKAPLAMHAAIHVALDDGREYVAEQIVGTLYEDFQSGLNWTPLDEFRQRDRGGWDVTVPATAFRSIDDRIVAEAVDRLNRIEGHPFLGEDCTDFIERVFGVRQLFADSPLLRSLGIRGQLGDPALPLIRRDARLDEKAERLLRADVLRALPDPGTGSEPHEARVWGGRILAGLSVAAAAGLLFYFMRPSHRAA